MVLMVLGMLIILPKSTSVWQVLSTQSGHDTGQLIVQSSLFRFNCCYFKEFQKKSSNIHDAAINVTTITNTAAVAVAVAAITITITTATTTAITKTDDYDDDDDDDSSRTLFPGASQTSTIFLRAPRKH